MKLFVTGGAGFIGANFIHYWAAEYPNDRLYCIDSLTYAAQLDNIRALIDGQKCTFICADIGDAPKMREIFTRYAPDIVVNFAAESHVDRSIEDASVFVRTNIQGVQVLLDECRRGNVRFHQVSTDEVYGDLPLGYKDMKFGEKSPLKPSSPYAATKASADLLALASWRTHKTPVTITRSSNNYGRFQHIEKLIPRTMFQIVNNRPPIIYGTGENVREWIHVDDHCRAIDLVLKKGKIGEVYNVSSGFEISNIELVRLILRAAGKDEASVVYTSDRKGHDLRYALDCSKIGAETGWKPQISFSDGLKRTVEWYLSALRAR